jgi:hypothetical protein
LDAAHLLTGVPLTAVLQFLVLRAFAAVLCEFHDTKDKLVQAQALLEQTQARAEDNQNELRRSLELAQSPAPDPDMDDYKL